MILITSNINGIENLARRILNQSIELASNIENNFISENKRYSRGVKQQPIWVLDATVMPGVLIELGFVSHPEEGLYLNSDKGKDRNGTVDFKCYHFIQE